MRDLHEHLTHKKHVIWDWNGTLLNDVELCVSIIGNILERNQMPRITRLEYLAKFRFPVIEYYKSLGFDFSKVSWEILAKEFIEEYDSRAPTCSLFEGAKDLLGELHGRGIKQSILSAAKESGLKDLVVHHDIRRYLDWVCGLGDHYAASKIDRGLLMLKESGIAKEEAILVGDTDHDLEVGNALGVEVLLLGDGHQCPTRLKPVHTQVLASRYR